MLISVEVREGLGPVWVNPDAIDCVRQDVRYNADMERYPACLLVLRSGERVEVKEPGCRFAEFINRMEEDTIVRRATRATLAVSGARPV